MDCGNCGNIITAKRATKYCSNSCKHKAAAKRSFKRNYIYAVHIKRHPNLIINYFEKIDTKEKAYWLGFLYADGYITKDYKSLRLHLSVKDEITFDKFLLTIGANTALKKYYGPYKTSGKSVQINITNLEFVSNLVKLGCTNKKSLTIRFPLLNSHELNLAFMLGYYDGDGTAGEPDLTGGSLLFFKDIKEMFNLPTAIRTKDKRGTLGFCFGTKLFREMIANYEFSMNRKRALYY